MMDTIANDSASAKALTALSDEVKEALQKYAIVDHEKYGKIYAFEVDGFGGKLLMDDSNVPSLLSLPYLDAVDANDAIYKNTRKFVLSEDNPFFFKGTAAEGIGGPHVGMNYIWPMSITMRGLTSKDPTEIKECITMLKKPTPAPVLCMKVLTRIIPKILPENGLPGQIHFLANCYGRPITSIRKPYLEKGLRIIVHRTED